MLRMCSPFLNLQQKKSCSAFLAPKFLDSRLWSPSLTLLAHGRSVVQAGQASRPGKIQALWEIYSSSLFVGPDFGQQWVQIMPLWAQKYLFSCYLVFSPDRYFNHLGQTEQWDIDFIWLQAQPPFVVVSSFFSVKVFFSTARFNCGLGPPSEPNVKDVRNIFPRTRHKVSGIKFLAI